MEDCGDKIRLKILNLDYLLKKTSWCINNNFINYVRLCKYMEQIIELSENNFVSHNALYSCMNILYNFIISLVLILILSVMFFILLLYFYFFEKSKRFIILH